MQGRTSRKALPHDVEQPLIELDAAQWRHVAGGTGTGLGGARASAAAAAPTAPHGWLPFDIAGPNGGWINWVQGPNGGW